MKTEIHLRVYIFQKKNGLNGWQENRSIHIDIIDIQAIRMQLSEIPNSLLFSSQNIFKKWLIKMFIFTNTSEFIRSL